MIKILILSFLSRSIFASIHYTLVAKTVRGKPCLNTCKNGYCAVDYELNTEKCSAEEIGGGVPTYYTSMYKGDVPTCLSNCDKFGYEYEWCFTTDSYDWDYCSSKPQDENHKYGYDIFGHECATNCQSTDTVGHFQCFTSAGVTTFCAKPATFPVQSGTNVHLNRRKRALDKMFSNELCSDICRPRIADGYDGYVQNLINGINARRDVEKIYNPGAPFTYVVTSNATNLSRRSVYLPLIVQATLRQIATLKLRPRLPSDITPAARDNINKMYNGKLNGTHVGHIISYQNGGTTQLFNYVGQTSALNLGAWKIMENFINDWINFNGSTVKMSVVVQYQGTAPYEFAVKLKFFNNDGTLHSDLLDMIFKNI